MSDYPEFKHFEIRCKKCGRKAKVKEGGGYDVRLDLYLDYIIATCTSCKLEEDLY